MDGKNITVQKDRTKTKSSYRTLPLVPPFEELLRRLKQEQLVNQKVCGAAYCKKYLDYIYVNAMVNEEHYPFCSEECKESYIEEQRDDYEEQ